MPSPRNKPNTNSKKEEKLRKLHIFVASDNPVKIVAARQAISKLSFSQLVVKSFQTESGVADQPMSEEETYRGTINRLENLYKQVLSSFSPREKQELKKYPKQFLFFAAEGGVYCPSFTDKNALWSTVWISVMDGRKIISTAGGAHFPLPTEISAGIRAGEELGKVMGRIHTDPLLKRKGGAISILSRNYVNRTEEYISIARLAVGLWYGKNIDEKGK